MSRRLAAVFFSVLLILVLAAGPAMALSSYETPEVDAGFDHEAPLTFPEMVKHCKLFHPDSPLSSCLIDHS